MSDYTEKQGRRAADNQIDLVFNDENDINDMYLTFGLGVEEYGISINYVTEIVGMQRVMEVPDVPAFIKGVINLRGKVIPVMDVRRRFNMPEEPYTERTVIIVLDSNGVLIGLIVDNVNEVMEIAENQIDQPPQFGTNRDNSNVIRGLGKQGTKVAILLNVENLISHHVIDLQNLSAMKNGA
jgi:purine-binding chemotaxis protein CheW